MSDIKPGYYIDPFDNLAIRSPLGNWQLWSQSSEDMTERYMHNPDPRSVDRLFFNIQNLTDEAKTRIGIDLDMRFDFIGDL